MATAKEFRWAASEVVRVGSEIDEISRRVRAAGDDVGIEGGVVLLNVVKETLDEISSQIDAVGEGCTGIGEQMSVRADACDAFTEELRDWLRRKEEYDEFIRVSGNAPFVPLGPRPQPTAPWMEASL